MTLESWWAWGFELSCSLLSVMVIEVVIYSWMSSLSHTLAISALWFGLALIKLSSWCTDFAFSSVYFVFNPTPRKDQSTLSCKLMANIFLQMFLRSLGAVHTRKKLQINMLSAWRCKIWGVWLGAEVKCVLLFLLCYSICSNNHFL